MQGEKKESIVGKSTAADMSADARINTDPNGSWTGVATEDPYEKPVQDADDL